MAGAPLFPESILDEDVVAMLLGYQQLPFEANPSLFGRIDAPPAARQLLRGMVSRNPAERPTIEEVTQSATPAVKGSDSLVVRHRPIGHAWCSR